MSLLFQILFYETCIKELFTYRIIYEKTKEKFPWEHQMTYNDKRGYPRPGGLLDDNIIQSYKKKLVCKPTY